nr:fimbrillin family protein [uncultured Alistipes sp.]
MKRTIISMLALAALAGCSKSESGNASFGDDVPVTLSAGIATGSIAPDSRAVVETGAAFTAGVAGWETSGVPAYGSAAEWYTTADITASTDVKSAVLKDPQTYDANNGVKTYMKAWQPAGAPANGAVTFSNTDGTVDVLLAGPISGSKNDNTGKVLHFAHKSTQLKFKVVADASLAAGTTIRKISVLNAELPTGIDLTADAVTYAAVATLDVPGIPADKEISTTAAVVGEPVMIRPMRGNTVTLRIETSSATFERVTATIDDDTNFVEGKAYTITLTFKQQSLSLTATVAEWTRGSGSAEVE